MNADLLLLPLSPIFLGFYMRVIALATKPPPSSLPPPTSPPPPPSRPSPPSRSPLPSRSSPLPQPRLPPRPSASSRLPQAPMPGTTANTNKGVDATLPRHRNYYITSADLIIRVENTLFRVHRYFFVRDSAYFRERLPCPPPPGDQSKGSSDRNPFVLSNTSKVEFERLLWVFYNPKYSLYDADTEEWTSVLKLANQWDFVEVKALVVRKLQILSIDPVQRILLYRKYAVNRVHLQKAFTELTMRDKPINADEGRELGLETVVQLADARERARAPVSPSPSPGNGHPRSPVTHTGVHLDDIIKDAFKLTPSSTVPRIPTGRNTRADSTESSPQSDWSDSFLHNSSEGHTNGSTNSHAGTNHTPSLNGLPHNFQI